MGNLETSVKLLYINLDTRDTPRYVICLDWLRFFTSDVAYVAFDNMIEHDQVMNKLRIHSLHHLGQCLQVGKRY